MHNNLSLTVASFQGGSDRLTEVPTAVNETLTNPNPNQRARRPTPLLGSAGLVVERLRVQIPTEAAGEFSSPELTVCSDSSSVSVPLPCYRS